jgi:PAS domain S-box-containing protein
MDTVLDGLITINQTGAIQSFNPAAERIFGYRPEEVMGQNIKILMPDPYHTAHDGYLKNYMTTGEKKVIGIGREVSAKRKDGRIFPMELGINEMKVTGTRMFVGTIRDISTRKNAEHQIQQHMTALRRSNQELDDFAYIASHDLKEPLRGLSNNARFLQEDLASHLDPAVAKRLDRMTYLCERMEKLVNDLLYFSRLGRQELAVQESNLNNTINDIELMMETTLQENNAKIQILETLPTIVCDLPRITEVFRNLITNAVKYNNKPEKRIEIGSTVMDDERVFYVRDNGIGIPEQFYTDIFRIFKRLNNEEDDVKGTGVGLTFVKKIIERHGGRIWLESEINKGTAFYFTIPELKETA